MSKHSVMGTMLADISRQQREQQRAVTERDTQLAIVDLLRKAGWYVRVFSQPRHVLQCLVGWPDVVAFKHGVVLLIEVKSPTGKPRAAQVDFWCDIEPHLSASLLYIVARSVDDVLARMEE